jgi:lipopolysaccharide transport system ATP-binding protein
MSDSRELAIEIKSLTKKYQLRTNDPAKKNQREDFYALRDVSFSVYKGEVIGIIGNNGSGKSTLLKILSQITKPTSGQAAFHGEVSSILDFGANFHPDLTGRENVNMHLRIAGIKKSNFKVIQSKALEFSEIGKFFDEPVKIYSSGMFLRLAFSVAFCLSSEILLLDEVLSVGDEGFRLKCHEMLKQLAGEGKTILFVSHNRGEVIELSSKCLWLDSGQLRKFGKPASVLGEYFSVHSDNFDKTKQIVETGEGLETQHAGANGGVIISWAEANAPGNEMLAIRELSVTPTSGSGLLYNTEPVQIRFVIDKKKQGVLIGAFFFLQDVFYQPVLVGHLLNNTIGQDLSAGLRDKKGIFEIKCTIPPDFLYPGKYYLHPRFGIERQQWNANSEESLRFSEKLAFVIHAKPGYIDYIGDSSKGAVRLPLDWRIFEL